MYNLDLPIHSRSCDIKNIYKVDGKMLAKNCVESAAESSFVLVKIREQKEHTRFITVKR